MYYVYVLKSKIDGSLYYGHSSNLKQRIKEHNSGRTKSLKYKIPLVLIYYEKVDNLEQALKKERYFKSGFGRKYIKNKLNSRGGSSVG